MSSYRSPIWIIRLHSATSLVQKDVTNCRLGIAERSLSRLIHFIHSSIERPYSTRPTKNLVALAFQALSGCDYTLYFYGGYARCARYHRLNSRRPSGARFVGQGQASASGEGLSGANN
jgi:hypothetical protein